MVIKNKYYKHSRITEAKFREIMKYFSLDLTGTQSAELELTQLNKNGISKILDLIRLRMLRISESDKRLITGYITVKKSYLVQNELKAKEGEELRIKPLYLVYKTRR